MAQYIDKSALVAEIESLKSAAETMLTGKTDLSYWKAQKHLCERILSFLNTLEVKEVGISIPNIDDILKEEGLDPDSKEAKVFKESYYMGLEKFKAQKGEEI